MTTPTTEQIEAREANQLREILKDRENEITKLKAALTAASGVGVHDATAMAPWDARYSGSAKEIEAHTIKRCAQKVQEVYYQDIPLSELLDAIMAMKE